LGELRELGLEGLDGDGMLSGELFELLARGGDARED
jgi:hypothetical protein